MLNCLVLGGNGFLGTHLVGRLLDEGHAVRVYDRGPSRFRETPPEVDYVQGELGNHGLVREAVEGMEVVFHLVSTTLPKTSNDDPIYDVRSNLVDTLQLLEVCVEAGVRKVVFSSSGGTVYGLPQRVPIPEEHPTEPITSYGIVKVAVENYLRLYQHLHGLDYAALRISNPYGPYQDPTGQQGVIGVFLRRIHAGETITIWGDGEVVRDYLYAADVAEALLRAAATRSERKVFNVGSGRGDSLNELLRLMEEVVGEEPDVEYVGGRTLDVPINVLDVSRARTELGWEPETELAQGIRRAWDWILSLPDPHVRG